MVPNRSSTPTLGGPNSLKPPLSSVASQGLAIPWRRPNVRHTSNELYVDVVESLSVTIAPSGRLLSALVSGTIAFTAHISGVPDLLLSLTSPGQQAIGRKMELPVFHPCVRLARWRERPGELSFVPPDGRFVLAGYEVDLIPIDPDSDQPPSHMEKVFLPAFVDMRKSLGPTGSDFEVRLTLNTNFPGQPSPARPGVGRSGSGTPTPSFLGGAGGSGTPSSPVLEEVVVTVPVPKTVRNITDMQASRGEAMYNPGNEFLEWRVPTKDAGTVSGTATLRCTVSGYQVLDDEVDDGADEADADTNLLQGYYDAGASYQGSDMNPSQPTKRKTKKKKKVKKVSKSTKNITSTDSDQQPPPSPSKPQSTSHSPLPSSSPNPQPHFRPSSSPLPPRTPSTTTSTSIFRPAPRKTKAQLNAALMPNSASVSFVVRGWLPSGIKVDSLNIDPRRSRGLGEGVKPYKGVKYLCVSRRGVETRC